MGAVRLTPILDASPALHAALVAERFARVRDRRRVLAAA
jgi:hypothetical protein